MREFEKKYQILQEEKLGDIHSTGYLLQHKKSKAHVLVIVNDDENKVFNISFRTRPSDSTGVAHILEHSVLCGSKHFPLKDPFVELVKGSLNTFLNAMTYPDKTCYPVASCNDQDFQNLMHVYLDAVFYPNIYQKEEIFRQEGWSYKLEKPEDELTYNGVVYNEMKGAFSSSDEVLERKIMDSLFPDTTYGEESGGDPQYIPDLTYQQFLDFHSRYYHPSNSYIYLYGNMDMEEKLRFLDQEYLSNYEELDVDSEIPLQKAFAEVRSLSWDYPIAENEEESENTYLSYNRVIGTALDVKLCTAFEILDYALLSAPGAPLKKALLEANIGKDIYGSYEDGIYQPYFSVIAKGSEPHKMEEFQRIIRATLEEIVNKGIDQKALEAGINYYEFRYLEADYASFPKGLIYGLDILETWLYDPGQPFSAVQRKAVYEELKKETGTGYFEKLIQRYLLENVHGSSLMLTPKRGLTKVIDRETAEKLAAYKEQLSKEEIQELVRKTRELSAYQDSEEEPEALRCIPMLSREDIGREAGKFYNEECDVDGTLLLWHEIMTNGIGYLDLQFDLRKISQELVPYVGLLKSVLGYVDTEHYTYGELFNEINAGSGGSSRGEEVNENSQEELGFLPMFGVRAKALYPQLAFVFQMIQEILFCSKLGDTKRLKEIIAQGKSRGEASLVSNGHGTAVLRATSYASPMAWFQEQIAGISYVHFLEELDKNFQERQDEIVTSLTRLMGQIFRPENLKVSFTAEADQKAVVAEQIRKIKGMLHTGQEERDGFVPCCEKKNEGFKTAGQVQYVAQTGNFQKAGLAYTGALSIMKVALSYEYLWMNIRVKGGAYGCMSGFKRNGESFFVSYRDPNLKSTLEVFQGIPEFIRQFQADERNMTKYIIGTISTKDAPKTPQMKGVVSRTAYYTGTTQEMVQREREQILDATVEDIRALASFVEEVLSQNQICVVGSEEAIERDQELFGEVKPLIC
ncbi:MAG: insulinase family protein [Blautia sp.]